MANVEFNSGNWVTYRDELWGTDKFAVADAVKLDITENMQVSLNLLNAQRNVLLGRIITDWSYPFPIPADVVDITDVNRVIGEVMPLKDYNELCKAVQPLMDELKDQ